jgi:hypothetical protein
MPLTRVDGDFTQVSNVVQITTPAVPETQVEVTDHDVSATDDIQVTAGIMLGADGVLSLITTDTGVPIYTPFPGEWQLVPGSYTARVTVLTGGGPDGSGTEAADVWLTLDVDRIWWVQRDVVISDTQETSWLLEIGDASNNLLDSATITVETVAVGAVDFGSALQSQQNGALFSSAAALNVGAGSFSLQAWVNIASVFADNHVGRVLRMASGGFVRAWAVSLLPASEASEDWIVRLTLDPGNAPVNFDFASFIPFLDEWFHVTVTVNRALHVATLYLEGAAYDTVSTAAVTGTVGLATQSGTIMGAFAGGIDELRVWSRVLTAGEIAANYFEVIADPNAEASLMAYWRFDENTGTVATDSKSAIAATLQAAAS